MVNTIQTQNSDHKEESAVYRSSGKPRLMFRQSPTAAFQITVEHRFHFELIHHAIGKEVTTTRWCENNLLLENFDRNCILKFKKKKKSEHTETMILISI